MSLGETRTLSAEPDSIAPDGAEVRRLTRHERGNIYHARIAASQVSRAHRHRTIDEIWYIISGTGAVWLGDASGETEIELKPGLCLTIRCGVAFQFRAGPDEALTFICVDLPPFPSPGEAERAPDHRPATI